MYLDTGESGETFDAEMYAQQVEVGNRVAIVKKGNLYDGRLGQVVNITGSERSSETVCRVDFGDSDIHDFSESDLIRIPSPGEVTSDELALAWSAPRKDPLQCQQWNNACLYDGYRFCPSGCGLWLCTHHYQKHKTSCPGKDSVDLVMGNTSVSLSGRN
jgi:hypothetical protein